jgi:hypothetical protein
VSKVALNVHVTRGAGDESLPAACERRERQRQTKNDEARPSPEAAREEFFRGV